MKLFLTFCTNLAALATVAHADADRHSTVPMVVGGMRAQADQLCVNWSVVVSSMNLRVQPDSFLYALPFVGRYVDPTQQWVRGGGLDGMCYVINSESAK